MILHIKEDDIGAVLLADGWHEIVPTSAMVSEVEYDWNLDDEYLRDAVREGRAAGLTFLALTFIEEVADDPAGADWDGRFTTVPLSSVLAVRHTSEVDPVQEQQE